MTNSIAACQQLAAQHLSGDNARLDGDVLLAFILNKPRSYLYTWPERGLNDSQYQQFLAYLQQAAAGKPLAYITGEKEFWSLNLAVTPATLIPRPDTECLIEAILADFDQRPYTLLDAGTGSGAIALALKKERPNWHIIACDKSFSALQVSQSNSERLHLPIDLLQSDWLSSVADNCLDILVSNPPYIAADDAHLNALGYEPRSALVADNHGLSDIQTLCQQAFTKLKLGAKLYIEHGYQQADAVQALLAGAGFRDIHSHADYAGNTRFSEGRKNE